MKRITLTIITLIFLTSCATQSSNRTEQNNQEKIERLKSSSSTWNEAPSEQLSGFGNFELNSIQLTSALQSDPKKQASSEQAGQLISQKINTLFDKWQQTSTADRTLVVEATFTKYQIVSGGARFWAGAFAGDSQVQLDVSIMDKSSGKIIAKPFFYQSSDAFAGAWTFGSHDRSIPERLALLVEKYLEDNFDSLDGGPTGRDE